MTLGVIKILRNIDGAMSQKDKWGSKISQKSLTYYLNVNKEYLNYPTRLKAEGT